MPTNSNPNFPTRAAELGARARAAIALLLLASACGAQPPARAPTFHADENPALLSAWGQLGQRGGRLVPGAGVTPYEL
ncbi:MAG: hypothetical protein ACR2P7_00330, partial [bacterium]